ncbi:hypothetical protein LIER_06778 [Lithospermum erythrorhizon]|uniref:Uncharacterized protein n=1 Tax=Lithospermum erythrorhizon TaxID=34254 RepID=A0AAV3P631_LITER
MGIKKLPDNEEPLSPSNAHYYDESQEGLALYVPLYFAALKGDCKSAREFLAIYPEAVGQKITRNGETAVHIAAGAKHTYFVKDLVENLMTPQQLAIQNKFGNPALCFAAASDLFDFAMEILDQNPQAATARDGNGEMALHILARKPGSFYSVPYVRYIHDQKLMHLQVLKLVKKLWTEIVLLDNSSISDLIAKPTRLLFTAAGLGIIEFLVVLIRLYPDLLWKVGERRRSIFHVAVENRQENGLKLHLHINFKRNPHLSKSL